MHPVKILIKLCKYTGWFESFLSTHIQRDTFWYCGTFCLVSGTHTPIECPTGTFSNLTGLSNSTECTPCTAGSYCFANGLTDVEGPCTQGYYCPEGRKCCNYPKYWDNTSPFHTYSKIWNVPFYYLLMCLKYCWVSCKQWFGSTLLRPVCPNTCIT